MYTNAIIGSYNTIATGEHCSMIMKPPIRRQPKKSHSKEGHQPPSSNVNVQQQQASTTPSTTTTTTTSGHHHHHHHRGNSAEEQGPVVSGVNSVNSVLSPSSVKSSSLIITSPTNTGLGPAFALLGLEVLGNVSSVLVNPDKIFSPEVSKIGFSIDAVREGVTESKVETNTRPLLRCIPTDGTNARSLSLQTLEGKTVLLLSTRTPYCCSWYQDLEARVSLPNGDPFATILKQAYGPCKCHRRFTLTTTRKECGGSNPPGESSGDLDTDKVQFSIEVLLSQSELLIKENSEVVAKVITRGLDCRAAYKVTFLKEQLSPNLKTLFISFAIILHIAFAETLNTCFGMCLCCCAGSSVAAWIMCVV